MNKNQIKDIFQEYGNERVFEKVEYMKINLEKIEGFNQDSLEAFFNLFEVDENMTGEHFVFLFCMFATFYEKEKFPIIF
ncbi:hypothetical protein JOC75_004171 [Metabacillus crassostreae]|uniref:hypothetical protein n=1 Tax=Metabacillus crassostreae TaxID=929098 RepID=UPI00195BE13F|nr:hypothetical protein [Metabacillus crassostreae]MBM7606141.1 hypothetical protein [Metabacillus crassostreae]